MKNNNSSILKKILIAGVPAGIFLIFVSALTASAGVSAYVSNAALNLRGWVISVLFYNLMIGLILAMVYDAIHTGIKADNPVSKGLLFGIFVWMLHTLPSIIYSFLQNPILIDLIKLEFITGFTSYPLVGVLIAIMYSRYIEK